MSYRMTVIHLTGCERIAWAEYGRETIEDMIFVLRSRAEEYKREAELILAADPKDFTVETYVGIYAQDKRETLQEGKK